jgi:colicin import membrane protein
MAKAGSGTRPHRSKADVQQEFLKIRDEVAATREARNTKTEEAAKAREGEVRQAVEGVSIEGVAQSIAGLSVQISKALADVSEHLIGEVQRLAAIREAVTLEREELQRLHKIDIATTAVDQLVQEYASKKQALEAEMSRRRGPRGMPKRRRANAARKSTTIT